MATYYSYQEQPTLLIGLGGLGSRIADRIYRRVKDRANISAFSVDMDPYDAQRLAGIPKEQIISIATRYSLRECIQHCPDAVNWFLINCDFFSHYDPLMNEPNMNRQLRRLLYELSLKEGRFQPLLDKVGQLAAQCLHHHCPMRVSVISTLTGGTGSGIFLQVALLIRDHLKTHYPAVDVQIQGDFILPSATFSFIGSSSQDLGTNNCDSNAYAALKELNAINQHRFGTAAPIKLTYKHGQETAFVHTAAYDYCFLYDQVQPEAIHRGPYVIDTIMERLFSSSSNDLNDSFMRERAGSLYGTIETEKLPLGSELDNSYIYRSLINKMNTDKSKRIFIVRSPKKLQCTSHAEFWLPQNTTLIEKIDPSASEIFVTDVCVDIELSKIEALQYGSGQYYIAYRHYSDQYSDFFTPHLDKNWSTELPDMGAPIAAETPKATPASPKVIPKEYFVFISYSTRDTETANQLKQILETNGVPCWMAPQSIPAGSDYGREIPKAIEQCAAFLLLLSDASQNSFWVPKEVGLAIGQGKIVVPFQIDNAAISAAFNFFLTNNQRISAYNRMTEAYQELLSRLKDILPDGTATHAKAATEAANRTEAAPVVFDMRQVRTFASCGNETTIFKVMKASDGQSITLAVNFEKTRLRDEIPEYAGVYYLKHPAADASKLTQIRFRARSEDSSIETIWVEIKPKGKAWMHESFDFCLSSEWEEYVIDLADFQFPETARCLEEITFVLKPVSFTNEDSLTGRIELGGLSIG